MLGDTGASKPDRRADGNLKEDAREARTEARTRLRGRLADHDSQNQGEAHQNHPNPKQGKGKVFALFFHCRTIANPGENTGGAGVNIGEHQDPGQGACIISPKSGRDILARWLTHFGPWNRTLP